MKQTTCALALLSALAIAPATVQAETDWSGVYLGAAAAVTGGHDDWPGDGRYDLRRETFPALHIGYNHRFGNHLVLGLEAAGLFAQESIEKDYPAFYYRGFQDYKIKAGYALDRVLLYASAGLSRAEITEDGVDYSDTGSNWGVGVDYSLSGNWLVGIEYTARKFDATCAPHGAPFTGKVDSVLARFSYKF